MKEEDMKSPIKSQSQSRAVHALSVILLSCAVISFAETPPWERLLEPAEPDTEAIQKIAETPKHKPVEEPAPPPAPVDKKEQERAEKERKENEKREAEKKEKEKKEQAKKEQERLKKEEKEKKEQAKKEQERLKKEEKEKKAQEKKAQEDKKAQEKKALEDKKAQDEKKGLEDKKVQDEKTAPEDKKAQDEKKAPEDKKAQDDKKALEDKKAQDEKKALEDKKAQDEKKALEDKKAQDEKKALEDKKAQDEKKALEDKKAQDEKKALEEKRAQEEKKAQEEKRAQEEKKALEEKKAQEKKELERKELEKKEQERKALEEKKAQEKKEQERKEQEKRALEEKKAQEKREQERKEQEKKAMLDKPFFEPDDEDGDGVPDGAVEPAKAEAATEPAFAPFVPAEPAAASSKPVEPASAPKAQKTGTAGAVYESSGSHLGIRAAVGIGGMWGHEVLGGTTRLVGKNQKMPGDKFQYVDNGDSIFLHIVDGIELGTSFSGGMSLVLLSKINDLLGISCEVQYSFYVAAGESVYKDKDRYGNDPLYWPMSEASVEMHTLEVPVLLRINTGASLVYPLYVSVGPQFGFNVYARRTEYNWNENVNPAQGTLKISKPNLNIFEIGPVVEAGLDMGRVSVGLRLYVGMLEYVAQEGGRPWSLTLGVTSFF